MRYPTYNGEEISEPRYVRSMDQLPFDWMEWISSDVRRETSQ